MITLEEKEGKKNIIVKEENNIPKILSYGGYSLNVCCLDCPREINVGDEVHAAFGVCNCYDYSIDIRLDIPLLWDGSAITKYATAPPKPVNERYSFTEIPFTFIMPDEPAAFTYGLFKKVNNKWAYISHRFAEYISITPTGYDPVIWDTFNDITYSFVHKVGSVNNIEHLVTVYFTNLGNQKCWQRFRAYLRWADYWQESPHYKTTPWGRISYFNHINIGKISETRTIDFPEEDAVIDVYLEHEDPDTGEWVTTETTTITIKPLFNPGTIHMKNINTEESLVPGTKPDYLTLSAVVPAVNKIHLFAKDSILNKPVTDILTVEEAVEGNIEIEIDPKTAFIKSMPNREWHLSLYGAADK